MSQSYVNSKAGGQSDQQQQQGSSSQDQSQPQGSGANQQQQTQQQPQQQQQSMNMMIGSSGEQMSQMTSLLLEFAFSAFVNKPQDIVEYAAQYFNELRNERASGTRSDSFGGTTNAASAGPSFGAKRASSDSQRSNLSQNSFNNDGHAGYHLQSTTTNTTATTTTPSNPYGQASEDELDAYDQSAAAPSHSNRSVNFQPNSNNSNSNSNSNQQAQPQPRTSYNRRKSVFAEAYDPAADHEDDENNQIVHGKTDEQRQRLAAAIKSIFLFRSVDPLDVTHILDAMFEVKVAPGDLVIRQGDDGDNFYVVERGKFQIYYTTDDGQRQVRGEYEDSGFFGELALMYNQPRAASVVALSAGSLWAMDRKTFRRIVLKSAFKKRKEYEALFEKVSVLQCLNVSIIFAS